MPIAPSSLLLHLFFALRAAGAVSVWETVAVAARDGGGLVKPGGPACGLVEEGPACGNVSCASFLFCVELATEPIVAGLGGSRATLLPFGAVSVDLVVAGDAAILLVIRVGRAAARCPTLSSSSSRGAVRRRVESWVPNSACSCGRFGRATRIGSWRSCNPEKPDLPISTAVSFLTLWKRDSPRANDTERSTPLPTMAYCCWGVPMRTSSSGHPCPRLASWMVRGRRWS